MADPRLEALRIEVTRLYERRQIAAVAARLAAERALIQTDAHLLSIYGAVLALQQRHEEAIAAYQAAVIVEPNSASLNFNLASQLFAVGRGEEAKPLLDACLRIEPTLVEATELLAQIEGLGSADLARPGIAVAQSGEPDWAARGDRKHGWNEDIVMALGQRRWDLIGWCIWLSSYAIAGVGAAYFVHYGAWFFAFYAAVRFLQFGWMWVDIRDNGASWLWLLLYFMPCPLDFPLYILIGREL